MSIDRKTVALFDLENTLIDSWNSGVTLNRKCVWITKRLAEIKSGGFIRGGQTLDTFGVFSFAVDNDHEKPTGAAFVKQTLGLDVDPEFSPSFKDMEALCRFQTDSLQKWEIVNLMGKDLMLPMWALSKPHCDFILFDDALPQKMIRLSRELKEGMQTILMIRVD